MRASLYRMAPVWPLGDKQVGHVSPSRPQFLFPVKPLISANSLSLMVWVRTQSA